MELLEGRLVVFDRNGKLQQQQPLQQAHRLPVDTLTSVSSSQVRACRDPNQLADMVVPSVLAYMQQHKLYQFAENDDDNNIIEER